MSRDCMVILGFIVMLAGSMGLLLVPIASDLETLASSRAADYVTVSALRPQAPWTSFAEVATGVAGTSSTVRQDHGEACRVWASTPGGGVAVGDLGPAFCQSVRVGDHHIALYRRGWFTGRLTLTNLVLIEQEGGNRE